VGLSATKTTLSLNRRCLRALKTVMLSEAKHLASTANTARSFAKTLRMTSKDHETALPKTVLETIVSKDIFFVLLEIVLDPSFDMAVDETGVGLTVVPG
jgi:hypothetical protein